MVARADERISSGELGRKLLQIVEGVDLPGQVVKTNTSSSSRRWSRGISDFSKMPRSWSLVESGGSEKRRSRQSVEMLQSLRSRGRPRRNALRARNVSLRREPRD